MKLLSLSVRSSFALLAAAPLFAQCPNGPVFGQPQHGPNTPFEVWEVRHADLDNDGDEDLVYRHHMGVEVRRNDGAAGFTTVLSFGATGVRPVAVGVGDFDRDGRVDIVMVAAVDVIVGTTTLREARLRTFRNSGPGGTFVNFVPVVDLLLQPAQSLVGFGDIAVGDLNADGMLDLVVKDGGGGLWVLHAAGSHGVPSGTFQAPVPLGTSGNVLDVEIADVDQDGAVDIVALTPVELRVFEGQQGALGLPLGTFGPIHVTSSPLVIATTMALRDFDHDGLPDVALTANDRTQIHLLRGLGGFGFAAPLTFNPAPGVGNNLERLFAGDFDRDGRFDLAAPCAVNWIPGPNFRVLRDPLGVAQWSSYNLEQGYPSNGVALDYDRDGLLDIAVGKMAARVTVAPGQCATLPSPGITVTSPNGGEFVLAGLPRPVQWTAATPVAAFDVDVSFDDGVTWAPVARQVIGTSCTWWVQEPSTNRGRIRVMPVDLPVFADVSDGPVTVGGPGLASAVPLGGACGQPFVPSANATVPHLGGTTTLEMLGASPNVPAAWWLSVPVIPPLPLPGGTNCLVWLDPAALSLLAFASTDSNGRYGISVPVPANSALVGFALTAQATAFVPASPLGLQISNGIGLVLGF